MTREEFVELQRADGWTELQQMLWDYMTPLCDAATFRKEMARPDGMIPVDQAGHRQDGYMLRLVKKIGKWRG